MGLGPFRSPLLRTSRLISLPPGTEMFQFPGFASLRREMTVITDGRVAPFGHLGIIACVPLPRASRSLPRPSSPPCAQASPTCLLSLDYKVRQAELRALPRNLPTNAHRPSAHYTSTHQVPARQYDERTMSVGKDSISHESIADEKDKKRRRPILNPSLFK